MWYLVMSKTQQGPEKIMAKLGEHLAWMKQQHNLGNVYMSGPTTDHSHGIIILNMTSLEEAEQLMNKEPFVAAGLRSYEIYEWDVHQIMGIGQFEFNS